MPRHQAPHAPAPSSTPSRPRRAARLRHAFVRPAVGASVALAVVATTGAAMASGDQIRTGAPGTTAADSAQAARLTELRSSMSTSREATRRHAREKVRANTAKIAEERVAKAAAERRAKAEKKRRAHAAKAARAAARARAAERSKASRAAARRAASQADPRSVARRVMGEYGFGADQWRCLETLWTGESGWQHTATNSSSGAYGIPQALPGSKMASAGGDWRSNPETQIRWGLGYIKQSYGTPCGALGFWNSHNPHWY